MAIMITAYWALTDNVIVGKRKAAAAEVVIAHKLEGCDFFVNTLRTHIRAHPSQPLLYPSDSCGFNKQLKMLMQSAQSEISS